MAWFLRRSVRLGSLRLKLALVLLFPACASISDLRPGDGHAITIDGRAYGDIWNAAMKVANEHVDVCKSDRGTGTILAERDVSFTSWGERVGIFVTPTTEGAPRYRIEVVNRKKSQGQITGQGWEHKVTRVIEDVLGGRLMR